MSSASVTYDFVPSTAIQSGQVDQNFADLVSFLNTHVVHNHPDQWPASMPRGLQGTVKKLTADITTSGTTSLTVLTLDAFTPVSANRRIKLCFSFRSVGKSVAGDDFVLFWERDAVVITEGANPLDQLFVIGEQTTQSTGGTTFAFVDVGPSAASHTYRCRVKRIAGTGTMTIHATPASGYIAEAWAEDIGGV